MKLLCPNKFIGKENEAEFLKLADFVQKAIDRFLREDYYLLQTDSSERGVCHRLAMYLEQEISTDYPDYRVDTEFNRGCSGKGYRPKVLDDKKISIDIAAHIRKLNANREYDNLIAIEMKKTKEDKKKIDSDKNRLAKLTDMSHGFGYKAGFFIFIDRIDMWIEESYAYWYLEDRIEFEKIKKERKDISRFAVERLARQFRKAVEETQGYGVFKEDTTFINFPNACCGDICFLLGQFLLEHEIPTWRVEGIRDGRTHAWLSTCDPELSEEWIVDITGDQYKHDKVFQNYNKRVYVDGLDGFHERFSTTGIYKTVHINELGLASWLKDRLWNLYYKIERCL